MKKYLLTTLLLAIVTMVGAQNTLSLGGYDDYSEQDGNSDEVYNGSINDVAPVSYSYINSGSQIIYTKDELADLAGKNITGIKFWAVSSSEYAEHTSNVRITIAETNGIGFTKDKDNLYTYYGIGNSKKVYEGNVDVECYNYTDQGSFAYDFAFDSPFYYSGENNIVVTFEMYDLDETVNGGSGGLDYFTFHCSSNMKRALTFSSDDTPFSEVLNGNRKSFKASTRVTAASLIEAPTTQFEYEDTEAPEETYFTYVPTVDEDFNVNGVEAYTVNVAGDVAKLNQIKSAKANSAVILKSAITPSFTLSSNAEESSDNMLYASDGTVKGDGSTIYALAKIDGETGFYRVKSGLTIPKGKGYLKLNEASSKSFIGISDGETTGINTVKSEEVSVKNNNVYNLAGQRVDKNYHGIVIVNGKKKVQ